MMKTSIKKNIVSITALIGGLILLNILGNYFYKRFDLTQDKRFTLSEEAKQIVDQVDSPLIVD
ncbi:MAG: gliding motility-associated ABC transporter substrate-binding protein GldG, partial [Aequorivita sp.]|nr:gliding motility-associated ABC transporter substrate-binding protein GldG [Aequorivita sp.]